jgi:hypothetical protein
MSNDKVCPLTFGDGEVDSDTFFRCMTGECMWYDEETDQCAMLMMAKEFKREMKRRDDHRHLQESRGRNRVLSSL